MFIEFSDTQPTFINNISNKALQLTSDTLTISSNDENGNQIVHAYSNISNYILTFNAEDNILIIIPREALEARGIVKDDPREPN